jgi:hypothetical protein
MKINNAVFLSYLRCPYKACLLLEGRSGQRTDYETLIADHDSAYKPLAQAALYRSSASAAAATDRTDNVFSHRDPPLFTFDAKIEHGSFECILDAIKPETDGPHGEPRYLPVVFCRTDKVSRFEELRLALGGHLLRLVQGSCPATGIVVHGANCSVKTVGLTPKYPAIELITAGLVSLATGQCRPPLILNSQKQPLSRLRVSAIVHGRGEETGQPEPTSPHDGQNNPAVQPQRDIYRQPALLHLSSAAQVEEGEGSRTPSQLPLAGYGDSRPEGVRA